MLPWIQSNCHLKDSRTMKPIKNSSVSFSVSPGFADWLDANAISLAFSAPQLGILFLVWLNAATRAVMIQPTPVPRASGLWCDGQRLIVAAKRQIIRFENILQPGEIDTGHDRVFIPRMQHTTGDLRAHDIGVLKDGRILFVNTLYSCLATVSQTHSFKPLWAPPFVSSLEPEDRCHVNGLAMRDGVATHVTAISQSDDLAGWRRTREKGGTLVDIDHNRVITGELSVPHSPRWYDGQLWLLNSGTGHLGPINLTTGAFDSRHFFPGFVRGLAFHSGTAIVCLSNSSSRTHVHTLPIYSALAQRGINPRCGVEVVDLASGEVVHWIRFETGGTELYDIVTIPNVRSPQVLSPDSEDLDRRLTFEAG